jgi:hypothetical protein
MLNADFTLLDDGSLHNSFRTELLPFLRIISHEEVLSSSVLEARLGALLNYLYGVNGERSVAVFTAAIKSSTTLGSAQVNDDLRTVAETTIALAKDCALSGNALTIRRCVYA